MAAYIENIDEATRTNEAFRRVLLTTDHSQLIVMALQPGEDIGMEAHSDADQFVRFEEGEGKAVLDGREHSVKDDWALVIPAGVIHNIVNTSDTRKLKLYAVCSRPLYPDGTVHRTRTEALEADLHAEREQAPVPVGRTPNETVDRVTQASIESFPASDPPSHGVG